MKRSWRTAGVLGAAAIACLASATPASASTSITEPADCSTTSTAVFSVLTFNMSCTGRPAGQQWQIVVWCNPRGGEGTDYFLYGNIISGNGGPSTGRCQINSSAGFADVYFNYGADVLPPGRYS